MSDLFKKAFSLGLGLTLVSKEKIEKTVDDLVERGKLAPGESKAFVERLLERGEEEQGQLKRVIQEQVKRVLQEAGVASESDVTSLEQRVAVLEKSWPSRIRHLSFNLMNPRLRLSKILLLSKETRSNRWLCGSNMSADTGKLPWRWCVMASVIWSRSWGYSSYS